MRPTRRRSVLFAAAIAFGLAAVTSAQRGGYMLRYSANEINAQYDGRFTFARLKYNCTDGYGISCYYYRGVPSWAHGFARTDNGEPAEYEMMQILDAISTVHPRKESNVFALDDPQLCNYPVSYMTEAGFWVLSDKEAKAFGAYLRKGGFVIFDDFRDPPRGAGGWGVFAENMRKILPGADIVDLDPTHPIFHSFFEINSFDIIPQFYDFGVRPQIRGIFEDNDRSKRLMAIINFNTDISQFWEYSSTGMKPVAESNKAFELGVNYIIYGLTH